MTKRQEFKAGVHVRIRRTVPYYGGSIGPILKAEAGSNSGRHLLVDIPGDGTVYFAVNEVELAPETEALK